MADYSTIDPILSAWAVRRGLQVLTRYQDQEVRYVILERNGVRNADLWIEPPTERGVKLHLAEYSRAGRDATKRRDIHSSADRLELDLDALTDAAATW